MHLRTPLVCALLFGWLPAAWSHHSYAMFDRSKVLEVDGTVAKVEWNNPHVWFWLYVQNPERKYDLFGFESGGISALARFGWSKSTLQQGDKIKLDYFPLRSGEHGGFLVRVIHPDGSVSRGDIASQLQLPGEKAPPPSVPINQGAAH